MIFNVTHKMMKFCKKKFFPKVLIFIGFFNFMGLK